MSLRAECQCGRVFKCPEEYAGRRARCPYCQSIIDIPERGSDSGRLLEDKQNALEGAKEPGSGHAGPYTKDHQESAISENLPKHMRANRRIAGKICPVCHNEIAFGDEIRNCPDCRQPHHVVCWEQNGSCGTYGCNGGTSSEPDSGRETETVATAETKTTSPKKPRIRAVAWVVLAGVVLVGLPSLIYVANYLFLQSPLNTVLVEDPRNSGIELSAHYGYWVERDVLVFDLERVAGEKAPADVFRVLLQYAEKLQETRFDTVYLAFQGRIRFRLSGSDFKELGKEYEWQNPVYTIRTFPEKLMYPDGSQAFPVRSGGALSVTAKQMEDFLQFHMEWWVREVQ